MTDERPDQHAPPSAGPTDDPVDPVTGDAAGRPDEAGVAETPAEPAAEAEAPDVDPLQAARDEVEVLRIELSERTADLQRIQAEFLNYKRRVDRDRDLVKENATYAALSPIIEVLDTIDRAREHAELEGGLKAVAEQLERAVAGLGLVKFGAAGDPFDPALHEALSHVGQDPSVQVTTCKTIVRSGFRFGDRVMRAAQVLVVDPAPGAEQASEEQ